jgi:CheY-like chemotaxis protein
VRSGRARPEGTALAPQQPVPVARKPTLLVVDDDPKYRRVLSHILDRIASVELCADGESALARLAARPFDWVLLDVGLPGMNGFEVLARVRALHAATQVLLHTGLALPNARRRALAAGAVELLEKPLSLPRIEALIRR